MNYRMTPNQRQRRKDAFFIGGAIAATLTFFGSFLAVTGAYQALICAITATSVTLTVIWFITRRIFVERESKYRGAIWGFFGGLFALYFSILAILFVGWALKFDGERPTEEWMEDLNLFFTHDNAIDVFASSIGVFILTLFFGGFLAPILGAIIGAAQSRTQISSSIEDVFE